MEISNLRKIAPVLAGLATAEIAGAETVTLLESFEKNVGNVFHYAAEGDRRITAITQSDTNDYDQITEGNKALKVSFENLTGWKQDFSVLLSPESTAILQGIVEELEESPEVGRYYLLYDITWDKLESDAAWSNSPLNFGGHDTGVQVEWAGGNQAVTLTYDLGSGLPGGFLLALEGDNNDQTFMRFIFNGNSTLPMDVYVDNIRLLDTKPEGGVTEVTVLDSFEENLDSLLPAGTRVIADPTINANQLFVTEGEKSAKFVLQDNPGGYQQDFTIDLALYSELEEVLLLPQEKRLQYSLAWDWIVEAGNSTVNWFQETLNPGGPGMQMTEAWASDGNIRTRVINLGTVEWDFPPSITVIHNSSQPWGTPLNLYLDNLRLINTGGANVPEDLEIFSIEHNADNTVTLSWESVESGRYALDSSIDLEEWEEIEDDITSEGETTTFTTSPSEAVKTFYRVHQLSPPGDGPESFPGLVTLHEDAPITEWSMDWSQAGAEGPFTGSTHEILFDEAGGGDVLWVTGQNYDGLATIRPTGERNYFAMPEGSRPHGLAFGADGQLFVSLESDGSIARVSNTGEIEEIFDIQMRLEGQSETINPAPHGIVVDPERGTVWFTGKRTSTVGRLGPDGMVEHYPLETLAALPIYLSLGPGGGVWGTELLGNKILHVTLAGEVNEYPIPTRNSRPIAITEGPDGNMWFSQESGRQVARIDASGQITEFEVPVTQENMLLAGLTFDMEGNLWTHGYIDQNSPEPAGDDYIIKIDRDILESADGSMSGIAVDLYRVPTRNTVMHRITEGPDGNIWFTELGADKVGMLDLTE